jgi:aspartate/methionine/tyrosine aminotransferase
MTRARAPYMEWARHRPAPDVDLAGSNLLPCTLDDLPDAREALEIAGESPDGYAPLVEAIARRYGVAPERVATAGGCSGANFLTCAALVDAGDHVLLEHPVYDPLVAAAKMVGAEVSFFERRFEEGYALDPIRIADHLKPKTRLVILSSPHNPSGVLAEESALRELGSIAEKAGVLVLADEVYLDVAPGSKHPPAATLSPAFISSNSLTKSWGLASLRCGWTLASPEITERIRRARDIVDVWAPIPADRLALVAFRNLNSLAARARELIETNSPLVSSFLASRPELWHVSSRSTIVFPRFRDGRDSEPFAKRLFEEHRVAVAPGRFFDSPSHFRLSFGGSTEKLRRGLDAISLTLDAETHD